MKLKELLNIIDGKFNKAKEYIFNLYLKTRIKTEEMHYSDLMPKDEVEKVETYHKALDWAINKNSRIKNIALSGPYGAGKSTIIDSYLKKTKVKNNKFLRISLATFSVEDGIKVDKQQLIEKSILEQMIYRVGGKKTPFSRFKKINKVAKLTVWKSILIWLTLGVSAWLLYNKGVISEYQKLITTHTQNNIFQMLKDQWLTFIITILFAITSLMSLYYLVKSLFSGFRIAKVNYDNIEIEISGTNEQSIYNKYLDELLYFFEETKYKIVIFEDIDRFNNTAIFTSLREINNFLNNYEKIKRRIIFLYAIKDDMFSDKDRTKFFDFIIPVIPFVDAYNSRQIVLDKFEELSSADIKKPSERLVKDITIFLDDMRLLTNIINEYIIYFKQINDPLIDADKLFSIIVYKNLLPRDFLKLQYNEGIVKNIFDKKSNIIQCEMQKIEEKITSMKKLMEVSDSMLMNSLEDLNVVFTNRWKKRGITGINTGNGYSSTIDINRDIISRNQNFNKNGTVQVYLNNSYSSQTYTYDEFFTAFGAYDNFFILAEAIELKNKETMQENKRKLNDYLSRKNELRLISLKDLVKKYNNIEIFEQVKDEELIIFLLREGKIDESYRHYISYFYPGAVTQRDMSFLRIVKSCATSIGYDYKLDKIDEIIKDISVEEFKSESVLNNDLLNYIIDKMPDETGRFNIILHGLLEDMDSRIEFIDQFYKKSIHEGLFINEICKVYPGFWSFIVTKSKFDDKDIERYFTTIMNVCDVNDIIRMNKGESIKRFIENTSHILQMEYDANVEEKFKKVISELNIKFYILDKPIEGNSIANKVEDKLITFILENNMFKINEEMLRYFYGYLVNYDEEKMKTFEYKNYTAIKMLEDNNLNTYVEQQLEEYLSTVFLKLANNIDEDLEVIESFLKNEEIDINIRIQIIAKTNCIIRNLKNVPIDLWNPIIEHSKWDITWFNITCYYEHFGTFNNKITEQLNQREVCEKLSISKIDKVSDIDEFADDVLEKLYQYLYENEDIYDSCFNIIQRVIPNYYDFEKIDVANQRMKLILDGNNMEFNTNNLMKLRNNYEKLWYNWTLSNIDSFLESIKEITLELKDVKKYLIEDNIKTENKVKLLNANKELIIKNIDDSELIKLIFAINEEGIISELDSLILEELISLEYYFEDRIYLLVNIISGLSQDEIKGYLSNFGKPLNLLVEERNEEEVVITDNRGEIKYILEKLVSNKYIKSFNKNSRGYSVVFDVEDINA